MELLYIWIENYKNIHHQGFNFSPRYKFDFDFATKKLSCIENEDSLPKDFFHKDIVNITAIVGENGSGKSSLIDITRLAISAKCFFIIELEKHEAQPTTELSYLIYHHGEIEINPPNQRYKKDVTSQKLKEIVSTFNEFDVIYYTPIFDGNYEITGSKYEINKKGPDIDINISTNNLLQRALFLTTYYHQLNRFTPYIIEESVRQILFLKTISLRNSLPFKIIPQNVRFSPKPFSLPFKSPTKYVETAEKLYRIAEEQKKKIQNDRNRLMEFYLLINRWNILFDYLQNITFNDDSIIVNVEQYLNNIILQVEQFELTDKNLFEIIEHINEQGLLNKRNIQDLRTIYQSIESFVSEYQSNLQFDDDINPKTIYLNLTFDEIEIEKVKNTLYFLDVFYNDERNKSLSTGELMYLNLLSRFYSVKDNCKKGNILVLIDEGDLTFHPRWQKEFLKNIIEVLPRIFENKKLQIILTSHSPFICSDLPSENIIFLKKWSKHEYPDEPSVFSDGTSKEGKCIVANDLEKLEKTFGQNIHTLFTSTFFMDGLIGDFALEKIKIIMNNLKPNVEVTEIDKKSTYQIIQMIGEDFIRTKLYEQFIQKYPDYKEIRKQELEKQKQLIDEELKRLL